jgi:hypothetical protein
MKGGNGKWQQCLYQVINNEKYKGKRPLYSRSSWETTFMRMCDLSPSVIEWASESVCIRYFNPIKGKVTRYYPDFLIKYVDTNGIEHIELIEIKPYKQTLQPKPRKNKKSSTLLQESKTYAVNKAKWDAAIAYCNERGILFRIITEKDLYGKISR